MTLHLELIRHGETELAGHFRGSTDDPLTAVGWEQLRSAIADDSYWDHIVTSPLQRCARFAEALAARTGIGLSVEPGLQELHFGDWEGRSSAQLFETEAQALTRFWDDPYAFTPPGAESLIDFEQRVLKALERLHEQHSGKNVLVVSHGGVIRLLVARARGLVPKALLQVPVGFAQRFRLRRSRQGALEELL